MATTVTANASIVLEGVTFSGPISSAGTTLSWTGVSGASNVDLQVTDKDDDGRFDFPEDGFGLLLSFTGYVVDFGGFIDDAAIFESISGDYLVLLPFEDPLTYFPTEGTSRVFDDEIFAYPLCFASGTMIATQNGETAVEHLKIGDLIRTETNAMVAIKWIGRQTIYKWRQSPKTSLVRIRAGTFGKGLPHSDLTVTADHGMVIDDYVINASVLVNGETIDWVPLAELGDSFTVYHIETEAHDVILANGAPTETYVDYIGRQAFDNYQEYVDLYGAEPLIPEMPMPRISARRHLPAGIRERLGISDPVGDALKETEAFGTSRGAA